MEEGGRGKEKERQRKEKSRGRRGEERWNSLYESAFQGKL